MPNFEKKRTSKCARANIAQNLVSRKVENLAHIFSKIFSGESFLISWEKTYQLKKNMCYVHIFVFLLIKFFWISCVYYWGRGPTCSYKSKLWGMLISYHPSYKVYWFIWDTSYHTCWRTRFCISWCCDFI